MLQRDWRLAGADRLSFFFSSSICTVRDRKNSFCLLNQDVYIKGISYLLLAGERSYFDA